MQKEAIYLKFYNGLSNNEIPQVMNVNEQSVYSHVSQAIIRMQLFVLVYAILVESIWMQQIKGEEFTECVPKILISEGFAKLSFIISLNHCVLR